MTILAIILTALACVPPLVWVTRHFLINAEYRKGFVLTGDCAGPHEIVHLAVQQGILAAQHAAGVRGLRPVDPRLLLGVVFTDPPVAAIGQSERALGAAGIPHLTASYPFRFTVPGVIVTLLPALSVCTKFQVAGPLKASA